MNKSKKSDYKILLKGMIRYCQIYCIKDNSSRNTIPFPSSQMCWQIKIKQFDIKMQNGSKDELQK